MQFEMNAQVRTLQGSGASRRLRRSGKVPGIIYGASAAPIAIELDHNELLLNLAKEAFHASVLHIIVDGNKEQALLRDVQRHAYKPLILHVDFQRVEAGHVLHQKVPLHFVNAEMAPGVKLGGGIISHVITELEISCLPKDLPEFIEVDLKDMQIAQSLHVSDIKLPRGVSSVTHGENPVVVSLLAKKGGAAEEEAAPAAPAAAAE